MLDINIADDSAVQMTFDASGMDELISVWGKHKPTYGWVYEIRPQGALEVLLVNCQVHEVLPHVRFVTNEEEWIEKVYLLLSTAGIEPSVKEKFVELWRVLKLPPAQRCGWAYSDEVGPDKDSFVGFFGVGWTFALTLSK